MQTAEHATAHEEHSHIVHPKVYAIVYCILMVLMIATVLVAQIPLGPFNNVVALTIAVIKAVLVVLFFMQVKYSSKLTWMWASIGFLWLIMLFAIVTDYYSRQWMPTIGWQQH